MSSNFTGAISNLSSLNGIFGSCYVRYLRRIKKQFLGGKTKYIEIANQALDLNCTENTCLEIKNKKYSQ